MTEREALFNRHSVRNYLDKKIEEEKISQIKEKIKEINEESGLNIQFVEDVGNTFNRSLNRFTGLGSAPSVIACVGEDTPDLDEKVGYYGQKIVLFLQMIGFNTCWAGMFNKNQMKAEIRAGERLAIVIAVGYGKDTGKPHKSKSPSQVSSFTGEKPEWFDCAVEAALLAPTAINQQKFFITCNDGDVSFADKGGPFSKVDLGIVRYCFELGKLSYEHTDIWH